MAGILNVAFALVNFGLFSCLSLIIYSKYHILIFRTAVIKHYSLKGYHAKIPGILIKANN
jgi:hypothetical protein